MARRPSGRKVAFNTRRATSTRRAGGLARYSGGAEEEVASSSSPGKQKFPVLKQIVNGQTNSFEFKYPPTNIQYENMSPEWVEVERPGLVPLIGLRQYRLPRLQFEFLLANNFDGIWSSVEKDLLKLRGMANSVYPVYFMYMDSLISQPLNLPGSNRANAAGSFYRVVDFSVNSIRRNLNNEITAAQCSMVLQEDYSLAVKAISMPVIQYPAIVKPRVSKPRGAPDPCALVANPTQCRRTVSELLAGDYTSLGIG